MRLAYADPPYLGRGSYYGAPEWDRIERHADLVAELAAFDGWAMSLTSSSLRQILPLCPDDVRIGAWVRPQAEPIPNVRPIYAWEPVIFRGGRAAGPVRDFVSCSSERTGAIVGAKPQAFCHWVLDLLGYTDGDELVDIYLGSGAMGRAIAQRRLL